jgi:hypothetical protein
MPLAGLEAPRKAPPELGLAAETERGASSGIRAGLFGFKWEAITLRSAGSTKNVTPV